MPLVYQELRRLASYHLNRESSSHTLQPTALVNEAYLRLVKQDQATWNDRSHFFAIAARMMRRILVDHARGHLAAKRGAGAAKLTLDEAVNVGQRSDAELIEVDQALERLAALDAQQAQVVELRFFAGLSVEEAADVLGISPATVKRDWASARAWLHRELSRKAN